ncbi:MAG: hypothetical protein LBQ63_02650 [Deltaproteobacteria bacterium]|jgi:hypothetical protein|nr:hypothetical protein [Deltaproteobacteria bacterium]
MPGGEGRTQPLPETAAPPLPSLPEALALDPAGALESSEDASLESRRSLKPRPGPFSGFLRESLLTAGSFFTYIGFRDMLSALYSIVFVLTASLWFGRLPRMPVAFLVLLPFVYLSALGAALLFLGFLRDRYIGNPLHPAFRRLLGPESFLAAYCERAGSRLLRSAFAVGVYLFLGLLYLAVGPEGSPLGWLLLPCLLTGMMAIFSLNHKALDESEASRLAFLKGEKTGKVFLSGFRRIMLKRIFYAALLGISLFIMFHYLVRPLRLVSL